MQLTDEQIIDAYFEAQGLRPGARLVGMQFNSFNFRLFAMRDAGVELPKLSVPSRPTKYPPERVRQLNEYVKKKIEGAGIAQQG